MKQRVENPKTRDQLSNMSDRDLVMYCYDNALALDSEFSRNKFIDMIYTQQFDLLPEKFQDIMDNPEYFEREGDTRYYFFCSECGHVTKDHIDLNTKFFDLHGKCGNFMYYGEYTDDEIDHIRKSRSESEDYEAYFMHDFYEEQRQESIEWWTDRLKKSWYYGYK